MSWSFWLILIPTICYGLAGMAYAFQKNWPMFIVYTGYAFANCGLLALDVQMRRTGF
jgi:hypothetical protein